MKNNFIIGLAITIALSMSGCATTPSKPRTFDQLGVFSSYPLNAHSYRVSFQADHQIDFGTAEEITLLKAAQVTILNGFQFFKVLDDPSNKTQRPPRQAVIYPTPSFYPYGYGPRRYNAFYSGFDDMPQVVNIDPIQVSYSIECYKNQKNSPNDAFDAGLILQTLGKKYGLSPTGQLLQSPATALTSNQ